MATRKHTSQHWKRYPGAYKEYMLQRNFGISLQDYEDLLAAQGGACAVCGALNGTCIYSGEKTKSLAVDHDHKTGAVRGLLCNDCNRAIGQLKDNSELLRKAADYLDFHARLLQKAGTFVNEVLDDFCK
jgi:Recombination endonuclease VII